MKGTIVGAESTPDPMDNPDIGAATDGMPEGGAAKFWDAEKGVYDWENHAKEQAFQLEQLKGKGAAEPAKEPATDDGAGDPEGAEAQAAAKAAGINLGDLNAHIAEHGSFPEDVEAKLIELGFAKEDLDDHARLVQGAIFSHEDAVLDAIGGEANIGKVEEFCKANYSEAERDQLQTMLESKDQWQYAVARIRQDMGALPASKGQPLRGKSAAPAASTPAPAEAELPPITDAELQAAIRHPLWKTSAKFRAQVERRAARSGLGAQNRGGGLSATIS